MAADDSDPGVVDLAAVRAKRSAALSAPAAETERGYTLGHDPDDVDGTLDEVCLFKDGQVVCRYDRDAVEGLVSWLRRREQHLSFVATAKAVRARMAALPKPPRTLDAYDRHLRERRNVLWAKHNATPEPALREALYKQIAAADAERRQVALARYAWDKTA